MTALDGYRDPGADAAKEWRRPARPSATNLTTPDRMGLDPRSRVLVDVVFERVRQNAKWGEQNHADGTGGAGHRELADQARQRCKDAAALGLVTFRNILEEEVAEAVAESDPARLRTKLIQVAAVAVTWAEKLDRESTAGVRS